MNSCSACWYASRVIVGVLVIPFPRDMLASRSGPGAAHARRPRPTPGGLRGPAVGIRAEVGRSPRHRLPPRRTVRLVPATASTSASATPRSSPSTVRQRSLLLDGELVTLDERGPPGFGRRSIIPRLRRRPPALATGAPVPEGCVTNGVTSQARTWLSDGVSAGHEGGAACGNRTHDLRIRARSYMGVDTSSPCRGCSGVAAG
jgi:hypothetical protein